MKEPKHMRSLLRSVLIASLLFIGVSAARAQVSVGISIGAPPPPRAVYVAPPPPNQESIWVEGYWYPVGHHYRWHEGYYTRAPYEGAYWVAPRYENRQFFAGYWSGDRGRVEHDHHWDRGHGHDRSFERDARYREHDRGHHYGEGDHDRGRDHDREGHHDHDRER
jgi:hypothetical protein